MNDRLLHETRYRQADAMRRLAEFPVTICGAGAVGANLTETLARAGFGRLSVIDMDRVEEHNLSTQPFLRSDVGTHKVKSLARQLYRALGISVTGINKRLDSGNVARLLRGAELVVDGFDNSASRQLVTTHCLEHNIPCLHVGLAADFAEVIWNEAYRVPADQGLDLCDYPLARNLVTLATSVAAETITRFAITGQMNSHTVTLGDLKVTPFH